MLRMYTYVENKVVVVLAWVVNGLSNNFRSLTSLIIAKASVDGM